MYSVWRRYFAFFETVKDRRVDPARPGPRPSAPALCAVPNSASKKAHALPNEKMQRFRSSLSAAYLKTHYIYTTKSQSESANKELPI